MIGGLSSSFFQIVEIFWCNMNYFFFIIFIKNGFVVENFVFVFVDLILQCFVFVFIDEGIVFDEDFLEMWFINNYFEDFGIEIFKVIMINV